MLIPFLIILLFVCYTLLIGYYWQSWIAIPNFTIEDEPVSTHVSIIIPARNEQENIGRLLTALKSQTYPAGLMEVIVVDDHSTDQTASIAQGYSPFRVVQLKEDALNSYKKKAIETGVAAASGELIITTDADCYMEEDWLKTIVSFYEREHPVFIAAPVSIACGPNLLEVFQAYDFAVLQGITGASVYKGIHSMSNGANMAYQREAFYAVNGFEDIDHIASGDDLLLMHKIATRYPGKMAYLKSKKAIVSTAPMKTWKEFFNQRIRWASKATHYKDKRIFFVLLLVYLFNLLFLVLAFAGCWHRQYWLYALGLWVFKTIVEFPFVRSVSVFFGKQYLLKYFFFFQPLHIAYTIFSGLLGQFGKYEWKGRKVK